MTMNITTLFSVGDKSYFLGNGKMRAGKITRINTTTDDAGTVITYTIETADSNGTRVSWETKETEAASTAASLGTKLAQAAKDETPIVI